MIQRTVRRCVILLAIILSHSIPAYAETYSLIVQPILPSTETAKAYAPLIDYLSKQTGHKFELKTSPNFLAYWQDMKKGQFDFVMDAAHLTDYKIKKLGYTPLAKVLDVVSFSLVTGPDVLVFEASELVGKPVASLASPSRGALIIEQLFTHPIRQPVLIEVKDAQEAVEKVLDGEAVGAVIPSPLVGAFEGLNVVSTTEQWPHVALSAARSVPKDVTDKVKKAMINAANTPEGQAMLDAVNFPGFENATPEIYGGYSDILKSAWGY